jgi:hypothetical protein
MKSCQSIDAAPKKGPIFMTHFMTHAVGLHSRGTRCGRGGGKPEVPTGFYTGHLSSLQAASQNIHS